jgi:peroxiredoxin Q/BCP|tara:strand:- start:236 stop:502 length:267 start_codon:yes stop_codon:yes gene_type:complete
VVLGISFDSKSSLKAFKEKYKIPFNFLSDNKKKVGKKYGVSRFLFPSRKTFLIDENGILIHIIDEVNLNTHPMDIIKIFEQAEIGLKS